MNRKIIYIGIPLVLGLSLLMTRMKAKEWAFEQMVKQVTTGAVPVIEPEESDLNTFHWIDARSQEEYATSKIKGAERLELESFSEEQLNHIDKSKPIVVYCSIGVRSEKLAEQLYKVGFKEVYNLNGGIFKWVNSGKSIVDHSDQVTNRIHTYNALWSIWVSNGSKVY